MTQACPLGSVVGRSTLCVCGVLLPSTKRFNGGVKECRMIGRGAPAQASNARPISPICTHTTIQYCNSTEGDHPCVDFNFIIITVSTLYCETPRYISAQFKPRHVPA